LTELIKLSYILQRKLKQILKAPELYQENQNREEKEKLVQSGLHKDFDISSFL